MKVILTKDVNNLGDEHDVVNVSEGYARNYLFPKKLAIEASASALAQQEKNKSRIEKKQSEKKDVQKKLANKISGLTIEIKMDAGESGKLFGSVTNAEIAVAIKEASGIDIDKKKVHLDEHIKAAGEYEVQVKLMADVSATLKLTVTAVTKK